MEKDNKQQSYQTTTMFRAEEYLDSEEAIQEFLKFASEENDYEFMKKSMATVDKARKLHGLPQPDYDLA